MPNLIVLATVLVLSMTKIDVTSTGGEISPILVMNMSLYTLISDIVEV